MARSRASCNLSDFGFLDLAAGVREFHGIACRRVRKIRRGGRGIDAVREEDWMVRERAVEKSLGRRKSEEEPRQQGSRCEPRLPWWRASRFASNRQPGTARE